MPSPRVTVKDSSQDEEGLVARLVGRKEPKVVLSYDGRDLKGYSLPGLLRRFRCGDSETFYTERGYVHVSSGDFGALYRWVEAVLEERTVNVRIETRGRSRLSALSERLVPSLPSIGRLTERPDAVTMGL